MKKIKYSNFESMKDILGQIEFNYDVSEETSKQVLFDSWQELIGKKLASVSKPIEITHKKVLVVSCKNSFIANELFMEKNSLYELLKEKCIELNLEISDIKFEYKNWTNNK